ncbi:hypothetical protein ABNG02_14390 [Halorubrum ejinorense]|uniref:Uncharacterized protein n=1 Tax=Halorubrum ejinorense TaxID=425309 RepID=A0AAV3SQF9_9EURY
MEDLYIYTGSFVVIGASIGGPAVGSLIAGARSIPILLMAIGGVGMLATAGYELLRTDPEEFTAPAIALLVLAGSACLSFLGTILSWMGGF